MEKPNFECIHDEIELLNTGKTVSLYERHYFIGKDKVIEYKTIDSEGNVRHWEATKDPERLTKDERHRVLDYCLSTFDDDEIVNYVDLFLQSEFIKETTSSK